MLILWITNTIFPDLCHEIGIQSPVSGGWMYGLAKQIAKLKETKLAVATTYRGFELKKNEIDSITYYLIPSKSKAENNKNQSQFWKKICEEIKPDIIHIHGTEYPFGLVCMLSNPVYNYIISIQGMVSVIYRYYYAGISSWEILKYITLRDIVRFETLINEKYGFKRRGNFEKEYLLRAKHIIGRTSWDLAHSKSINPSVKYHFCNESLRDCFYTAEKWDIKRKHNFTIFLSQASEPIKGLHQVLKAVSILKTDFPDIKILIAGADTIEKQNFLDKLKMNSYGSYIKALIARYKLKGNVKYVGLLTADQMINMYQSVHLFVCPSSIENSPNSLCEAQLLGVPIIASYVGGIPDLVVHGETGLLYRFEEFEMLAEEIRKVFNNDALAKMLSFNGIQIAEKRHDRQTNLNKLINIYNEVIK